MRAFFATEEDLITTALQSQGFIEMFYASEYEGWGSRWEGREVKGLFGIPDLLIAYGKVASNGQEIIQAIAFEMKIRNWKRALAQAYRYSAFAHYSYVILDEAFSVPARNNIDQFKKANIGLLSIDIDSKFKRYYCPTYQAPYSLNLYKRFYDDLSKSLFNASIPVDWIPRSVSIAH